MSVLKMSLKLGPGRGSHLPILMKAVADTDGPILELGCGVYSTNPLHWACMVAKRRIVTYENTRRFYGLAKEYRTDFHEVHCIEEDGWDDIDLSEQWAVAFVDHAPAFRRGIELGRLTHTEYVVAHDTEPQKEESYHWNDARHLYKYQYEYTDTMPQTTIFSNTHDVRNFV